MKSLLLFITLSWGAIGFGQIFHFDDTLTTLVKDVTQSPAHWYLEIYNECGVDTTLRWKASFNNVPLEWNINFDDQTNFHSTVLDGDSADFTLLSGLTFPQKLIIGAAFNDMPGIASIYFDIYNPLTPGDLTTIEYHYIVGQAGIEELGFVRPYVMKGKEIFFDADLIGSEFTIMTFDGKVVNSGEVPEFLKLNSAIISGQSIIIQIINDGQIINYREFVFYE